jgi:hypothetical protein
VEEEPEQPDKQSDIALGRIKDAFAARSKTIVRHTIRTSAAFAVSLAAASLFAKGMPLHPLFFPCGQILLVVCALTFTNAFVDAVFLIGDWRLRRKLNEID